MRDVRVRALDSRDIPRLQEMQADYAWGFGPDLIGALALVDEQDRPVMIVGAWRRAEVHMLTDHAWGTPQQRLAGLREIHDAMERELAQLGVGEVHTFMDPQDKRFAGRLEEVGWQKCEKDVWVREVRHV